MAIPLRSWRSRIFSKINPNRRGSVDSHTIWGLDASRALPLRFYYASATLLLRSHYVNEDLTTLSLRWWRCSCDLATTLAMELRFRCAFVSFLYRIWNSDTLLLRPVRFYCSSTALLSFLLRFVSFWPKFRIVAESPSSGMGGGSKFTGYKCPFFDGKTMKTLCNVPKSKLAWPRTATFTDTKPTHGNMRKKYRTLITKQ